MAMRATIVLILMVLATTVAAAQQDTKLPPFDPAAYSGEVRNALRYAEDECKQQGGDKVTFATNTVRRIDLTGDGREDHIVDFSEAKCDGVASAFCGTAGCTIDIIVTLPNGKSRSVFSDRVRSYDILPGEGARTVTFALHGSFCGRSGNPSCIKRQRITSKPFAFREPR